MIGSRQLGRVLKAAEQAGAKVVLLGDDKQLAAIEAGAEDVITFQSGFTANLGAIAALAGKLASISLEGHRVYPPPDAPSFGLGLWASMTLVFALITLVVLFSVTWIGIGVFLRFRADWISPATRLRSLCSEVTG